MTSNEAVNEPAGEQAVEFQGIQQPLLALALVNGHRVISCENYECFIGVSSNVSDLKKFIGVHVTDTSSLVDRRTLAAAGTDRTRPASGQRAKGLRYSLYALR